MDNNDILDSTEALFASKNIHFTLAELSQKLGVKPPSLYNHFKSKEEIIRFTIFREIDNFFVYVNQVIESLSDETLEVCLEKFFKQTLSYFNSLQKARFWRQLSLLEPGFKVQFSVYRAEREATMKKKLDEIFDLLAFELKMTVQKKQGAFTLMYIMMQGLIEIRVMSDSVHLTETLLDLSWDNYLQGLKNKPELDVC